jgi:hypothetical protein
LPYHKYISDISSSAFFGQEPANVRQKPPLPT